MKKIIIALLMVFLCLPTRSYAVFDEERGQEIKQLTSSKKLWCLFKTILSQTTHWAGNHKKLIGLSTLGLCTLTTIYYAVTQGAIEPCTLDENGIFDLHACMHYLKKSGNTATLDEFVATAQEKVFDLWNQIPDPKQAKELIIHMWKELQSDVCHIHDEL